MKTIGYRIKQIGDAIRAMRMARTLQQHDRWPQERLELLRRSYLARLVRFAKEHSPFYGELYRNIDCRGDVTLESLPAINKEIVMQEFDRLVTDRRLKLNELKRHLEDLQSDEYYLGKYRIITTAGSSGRKGVFVFDRIAWSSFLAATMRVMSSGGVSPKLPRVKFATVGADNPRHSSYRLAQSGNFGQYRMLRLHASDPLNEIVRTLNAFGPEVLFSYPSFCSVLAMEQSAGRLCIHIKTIFCSGEVLTQRMREAISNAWPECSLFNAYGSTEMGFVGVECSHHGGLHLFEDQSIIEVVDAQNNPVPKGNLGQKLLVTNLCNRVQPIIRYEITDTLLVDKGPCPCGAPFDVIRLIGGRSDDFVYLESRDGRMVAIHPFVFENSMTGFTQIREYQVVQNTRGLRLKIVLQEGQSSPDLGGRITSKLRDKLAQQGVANVFIEVVFLSSLEREAEKMGKLKLVISQLGPHTAPKQNQRHSPAE